MRGHRTYRTDAGNGYQPFQLTSLPGPGADPLLETDDPPGEHGNLIKQQLGHLDRLFQRLLLCFRQLPAQCLDIRPARRVGPIATWITKVDLLSGVQN